MSHVSLCTKESERFACVSDNDRRGHAQTQTERERERERERRERASEKRPSGGQTPTVPLVQCCNRNFAAVAVEVLAVIGHGED
jgi:hypothetical protein